MGDRPRSPSRVRMSEDKVRRKDLCGSVRAVYVLEKLPDISGPGLIEAGRYIEPPCSGRLHHKLDLTFYSNLTIMYY